MVQNKNIILPNMITLLNLLCGFYAMIVAARGDFIIAAMIIILAAVFDGLDGKVARLVNGTSEFGIQLDSLADVVSFGVAPAILLYYWSLHAFGKIGLMVAFLFSACGALRLARFNVQTKVISNIFFVGIPIPGGAAIITSWIMFADRLGMMSMKMLPILTLAITGITAFLMVSTIPYYSFKNIAVFKAKPFNTVVGSLVLLCLVGMEPKITIFLVLLCYVISGFIMKPFKKRVLERLEGPSKEEAK